MYQPQEKTAPLIASINDMVRFGVNDLRLASIRRDLASLERAGLHVDALQIRGMLAALTGDTVEVDRRFSAAKTASGNLPTVVMNHALAMSNIHRFVESVLLAQEAMARAPDDPAQVREAFDIFLTALDVDSARDALSRLQKLQMATPADEERVMEQAPKQYLLAAAGVSWRDVAGRIGLASDALRQAGFAPKVIRETACEDGLLLLYCFDAQKADLSRAENTILEAIAEAPYAPVDSVVAFGCSALQPHEH